MLKHKVYGPARTDFGKPPPGYIPGVGRGATSFTTRSDIGPASGMAMVVPERGMGPAAIARMREKEAEEANLLGASGIATGYKQDDLDAENVYADVDAIMNNRKKKRDEEDSVSVLKQGVGLSNVSNIKKSLTTISMSEWEALPDSFTLTKRQKQEKEIVSNATDSLLIGGSLGSVLEEASGSAYHANISTDTMDIMELGTLRGNLLESSLDQQTGLLHTNTQEESLHIEEAPKVILGDVKKLRLLYSSMIKSNPHSSSGWISACRLERECGRVKVAKQQIHKACEENPRKADLWVEALDLYLFSGEHAEARAIAANAQTFQPHSVELWLRCAELEEPGMQRLHIVRRALQAQPKEEAVWMKLITIVQDEDAKTLLVEATSVLPQSVCFWLAQARLQQYDEAKKTLNQARKLHPGNFQVWLSACMLEEDRLTGEAERASRQKAQQVLEYYGIKAVSLLPSWVYLEELYSVEPRWVDVYACMRGADPQIRVLTMALGQLKKFHSLPSRGDVMNVIKKIGQSHPLVTYALCKTWIYVELGKYEEDKTSIPIVEKPFEDCSRLTRALVKKTLRNAAEECGEGTFAAKCMYYMVYSLDMLDETSAEDLLATMDVELHAYQQTEQWALRKAWIGRGLDAWKQAGIAQAGKSCILTALPFYIWSEKVRFLSSAAQQLGGIWISKLADIASRACSSEEAETQLSGFGTQESVWEAKQDVGYRSKNAFELLEMCRSMPNIAKEQVISSILVTISDAQIIRTLLEYSEEYKLVYTQGMCLVKLDGIKEAISRLSINLGTHNIHQIGALLQMCGSTQRQVVIDRALTLFPKNAQIYHWSAFTLTEMNNVNAAKKVLHTGLQQKDLDQPSMLFELLVEQETAPKRRGLVMEMLQRCDDSTACCVAARYFWQEQLVGKARAWFHKSVDKQKGELEKVRSTDIPMRAYIWKVCAYWLAFETEQVEKDKVALLLAGLPFPEIYQGKQHMVPTPDTTTTNNNLQSITFEPVNIVACIQKQAERIQLPFSEITMYTYDLY